MPFGGEDIVFGLAHTSWWVNMFACHILYRLNVPKLNILHERIITFIKDYSTGFLDFLVETEHIWDLTPKRKTSVSLLKNKLCV
jgi:hypothetical protein